MEAFKEQIGRIAAEEAIQALIITGGGETFVSGGDLQDLRDYTSEEDGRRLSVLMGDALFEMEQLPIVTIAALNGPARGGGAEIAIACDIRVMDENADIGFVHTRLGIVTAWGGGTRLQWAVGYASALELLTTGRVLNAAEAKALGLISRVTPAGEALSGAINLAGEITANPRACVHATKRFLQAGLKGSYEQALLAEREEFPRLWDTDFRRQAVEKFLSRPKKTPSNGQGPYS
jgi:enoyl-CoA hydratase/carnithine racemase